MHGEDSTLLKAKTGKDLWWAGSFLIAGGRANVQAESREPIPPADADLGVKPHIPGFWGIQIERKHWPAPLIRRRRLRPGRMHVDHRPIILAESYKVGESAHHWL